MGAEQDSVRHKGVGLPVLCAGLVVKEGEPHNNVMYRKSS